MKHKSFIIFCLGLMSLVFVSASQAQFWGDSYSAITYNMGLTTGETKDFISPYSWRGLGLDFRKFNSEKSSFGLTLGWNIFHEETNETLAILNGSGHATGRQNRILNAFPIMLGFQYYGGEEGRARPYLGLNAGGFIIAQRMDIGIFSFQEDGWNWGGSPEVGLMVPMKSGDASLLLNVRYNYAFEGYDRGPYSYLSFNVGFAWSSYNQY
jgi:hypothetical protein